jgi:hypothetical protein
MQYKTIVLELLWQRPQMHERLRRSRTLLATLNRLAAELKAGHEAWKERLAATAGSGSQTASTALELALKDLTDSLPDESPAGEEDLLSLDEAMAFLRRPTPHE